MAEVTVAQLHEIMGKPENIRNWTIIGTEEHGRETISQVLDDKAGVLTNPGAAPPSRLDQQKCQKPGTTPFFFCHQWKKIGGKTSQKKQKKKEQS